jgi:hypothetical protein
VRGYTIASSAVPPDREDRRSARTSSG